MVTPDNFEVQVQCRRPRGVFEIEAMVPASVTEIWRNQRQTLLPVEAVQQVQEDLKPFIVYPPAVLVMHTVSNDSTDAAESMPA